MKIGFKRYYSDDKPIKYIHSPMFSHENDSLQLPPKSISGPKGLGLLDIEITNHREILVNRRKIK